MIWIARKGSHRVDRGLFHKRYIMTAEDVRHMIALYVSSSYDVVIALNSDYSDVHLTPSELDKLFFDCSLE
jgi:hypothetical protein